MAPPLTDNTDEDTAHITGKLCLHKTSAIALAKWLIFKMHLVNKNINSSQISVHLLNSLWNSLDFLDNSCLLPMDKNTSLFLSKHHTPEYWCSCQLRCSIDSKVSSQNYSSLDLYILVKATAPRSLSWFLIWSAFDISCIWSTSNSCDYSLHMSWVHPPLLSEVATVDQVTIISHYFNFHDLRLKVNSYIFLLDFVASYAIELFGDLPVNFWYKYIFEERSPIYIFSLFWNSF